MINPSILRFCLTELQVTAINCIKITALFAANFAYSVYARSTKYFSLRRVLCAFLSFFLFFFSLIKWKESTMRAVASSFHGKQIHVFVLKIINKHPFVFFSKKVQIDPSMISFIECSIICNYFQKSNKF